MWIVSTDSRQMDLGRYFRNIPDNPSEKPSINSRNSCQISKRTKNSSFQNIHQHLFTDNFLSIRFVYNQSKSKWFSIKSYP